MADKSNFYKLIHIGKSSIKHRGGYFIACQFQPLSLAHSHPVSEDIFYYEINSAFADSLIYDTIWTDAKGKLERINIPPSDTCTFKTGADPLYARRLKHIFKDQASAHHLLITHSDTWVVSVKLENKTILIPYFELLRSLFYQTSRRITDFIFSKTPLKFLCRPLTYPDSDNSFTARYCIAATHLKVSEARLLGCMLFDKDISYIFNTSQAYWLSASSDNDIFLKEGIINAGNFNSFYFKANGYHSTYNNEQYFWVNELDILQYNYNFNKLIFHPITDNQDINATNEEDKLPEVSDILQITKNHTLFSAIRNCTDSPLLHKKEQNVTPLKNSRNKTRAIRKSGILPLVVCMPPWASNPLRNFHYKYFDDKLFTRISSPVINTNIPHTSAFQKIINSFNELDYKTHYLTINNSEKGLGEKISAFPIYNNLSLSKNIYANNIQTLSIIEIQVDNAIIYITQPFPNSNPGLTLLIMKQSLTELDNAEWNDILDDITPVKNTANLTKFYKRIGVRPGRTVAYNTATIAIPIPTKSFNIDFCLDLVEHVINRFIKRLQFFLAVSLRYPQGITKEQQKIIKKLSHNTCRTLNAPWKTRIRNLWDLKHLHKKTD